MVIHKQPCQKAQTAPKRISFSENVEEINPDTTFCLVIFTENVQNQRSTAEPPTSPRFFSAEEANYQ